MYFKRLIYALYISENDLPVVEMGAGRYSCKIKISNFRERGELGV